MKIRVHHSQMKRVRKTIEKPSLTEQSHAESLNIRTMFKKGVRMSRQQPIWGDASQIPSLDLLLMNRRRLMLIHDKLPARVKADVPTLDDFVRLLSTAEAQDLVDVGLLDPAALEEQPDPDDVYLDKMASRIADAVKESGEDRSKSG